MLRLLNSLGAKTSFDEEKKLCMIDTSNLTSFTASYDLVKTMRSSILVLGPLLAKYKQAKVSMPGGCAIGARPVDFHLQGLEKFGCQIEIERGDIVASFKQSENTTFTFPRRSVTGTENLIMAACLGNSAITLDNCAKEPHVTELAIALNAMGAKISGAGTDTIVIEGVDELKPMDHTVHPDYIEAGTFLIAGAITKGDMIIHQFPFDYLSRFVEMMHEMGVHVENLGNQECRVRVFGDLQGVDVVTADYPGFPTDLQAQMLSLMCLSKGISVITENIFENRFMHVSELQRLGANIRKEGKSVIVRGVEKLCGAPVMATDLRASASLVLAGLAADGITEVSRIYHLDRGYEVIENKLEKLNAKVARVDNEVKGMEYRF